MPNFAFFKGLDDAQISQKQLELFPLAYQIYLWCLQVANKGRLPLILALKCAYFSPVSQVSERVSSF